MSVVPANPPPTMIMFFSALIAVTSRESSPGWSEIPTTAYFDAAL